MTRKRFIKLYMSYGYSRDEANLMALYALCRSGCYEAYYNSFQSIAERHTKGTVKAWQQISQQVQTIVPQVMGILEAPLKGIAQALNLM